MARTTAAIALGFTALLTGCGFGPRQPPCNVAVVLASSADDAAATATMTVLARRITEMGGDVAAQTRDGDRVSFVVTNCPSEKEQLRKLLLSPGRFRIDLKDRPGTGLTEADVVDANMALDFIDQRPVVTFRLTSDGTSRFAQMTGQAVGHPLQLKWDGKVISEPVIMDPITSGTGQVGPFAADDAVAVTLALRSGPLPIGIRTVQISPVANANE
jgi:hypothetical protein